jgi:hypothetical protein
MKLWILKAVDRSPWTGDQPVTRPLLTQDNTIKNKGRQTFMPRVVMEPKFPLFERAKTFLSLESATSLIGNFAVI